MKDKYNITFGTIEKSDWKVEIPGPNTSYVLRKAYELHHKKIDDFTPEDVRFAVNQEQHLEYTVPHAITLLQKDIFVETDFDKGSLLHTVLRVPEEFWKMHPQHWKELDHVYKEQYHRIFELDYIGYDIDSAYERFARIYSGK